MVKSLKMIEHRISASPAQMRKLMSGGAITLKPMNFDPSSRRMIMVRPNTSRRIATAMRKNKGVRIMLKPDEDIMEETEGGAISLKSIGKAFSSAGKTISKGVTSAAKDVGKALTSRKAINTYKAIGREALPIAKGIADAGIDAGSMALATYMGNPALAPVIAGTAKVGLDRGYSALGKEVGLDPNTPVPYIDSPEAAMAHINLAAEKNIRQRTKGRVRDAALAGLSGDYATAQRLATDYAIDKKLKGVEQKIARKAQRGEYQSVQDLATDYAAEKLADAMSDKLNDPTQIAQQEGGLDELARLYAGRGLMGKVGVAVRKTRKGLKLGGASPYLTSSYDTAMGSIMSGGAISGVQSAGYDMRGILPATAPSSVIQLGSPYQRIQSPAMSPFIAVAPQLDNRRIGGSFMPAGRRGGGFNPAG